MILDRKNLQIWSSNSPGARRTIRKREIFQKIIILENLVLSPVPTTVTRWADARAVTQELQGFETENNRYPEIGNNAKPSNYDDSRTFQEYSYNPF